MKLLICIKRNKETLENMQLTACNQNITDKSSGMKTLAHRDFLESLGIARPVIQAPMAGVTTPRMVAEVCNNGALGSLPVSHIDLNSPSGITELKNTIHEVMTYTNG